MSYLPDQIFTSEYGRMLYKFGLVSAESPLNVSNSVLGRFLTLDLQTSRASKSHTDRLTLMVFKQESFSMSFASSTLMSAHLEPRELFTSSLPSCLW